MNDLKAQLNEIVENLTTLEENLIEFCEKIKSKKNQILNLMNDISEKPESIASEDLTRLLSILRRAKEFGALEYLEQKPIEETEKIS